MLAEVGIPEPERRSASTRTSSPAVCASGWMIAMALACEPSCSSPTSRPRRSTSTVQAQILELIARLQQERGLAVVMITHDLGVVARVAPRVLVMYGGRAVEQAPVDTLFATPAHPYARGLLDSLPRLDDADDEPLRAIPGKPAVLLTRPQAARSHPAAPAPPRLPRASDCAARRAPPALRAGRPRGRLPPSHVRRHSS